MLLYAVTAVAVKPAGVPEWFRLCPGALAAVISPEEDVADVLLRLPDSWNVVEGARCDDLHDEIEVPAVDPRFHSGLVHASCAIVAHDDGARLVLLMQVNAADSVLLPCRLFRGHRTFERCVWPAGRAGR